MPRVKFIPTGKVIEVETESRLLTVAVQAKELIRYGCGVGTCCLCGVKVGGEGQLNPLTFNEEKFFDEIGFDKDGAIRLACQCEVLAGEVEVDLDFQETYDPADASLRD